MNRTCKFFLQVEKVAKSKTRKEFEKYRQERNKKYISDFDREVKKLLKPNNKK